MSERQDVESSVKMLLRVCPVRETFARVLSNNTVFLDVYDTRLGFLEIPK
jgi:hypothetical protein